jgi:hypothetical protein
MKTYWTMVAVVLVTSACTPNTPRCTPQSCASGCCTEGGLCAAGNVNAACGLNGAACVACGAGSTCELNECRVVMAGGGAAGGGSAAGGSAMGGGSTAGGTAAGGSAAGGSAAGGSAAGGSAAGGSAAGGSAAGGSTAGGSTAGGSAAGGSTAGGSTAGGSAMDAGATCATTTLDPALGTFALRGTTTLAASGALPAGTSALGLHNGVLFTVTTDRQLRRLGTLPALSVGPAIVDVRAPADRDGGTFLGGTIASNGQQLLAGYTKAGAGFPGVVALVQPEDGGVEYVSAPGNYTAAGLSTGAFVINGTGLGSATGNGLFALRPGSPSQTAALTTFPDAFGGSGYTTVTGNGVLVAGNARTDFSNVARALPPSTYLGPLASGSAFTYQPSDAPVVAEGDTFADLTAFQNDAVVVRGGYDSMFNPFTTRVERVPLTLTGSGVQTVTVGAPQVLLENTGLACTRVFAALGRGADLYLGLDDRQGRRLVKLVP